jgi:ABC-2 type transport system permease protein
MVAVQYAMVIGLLPTALLSGFIFPVEYMPRPFRVISNVFPVRWYMELTRDQFLKGTAFGNMRAAFWIMGLQFVVILAGCLVKFKRTLE